MGLKVTWGKNKLEMFIGLLESNAYLGSVGHNSGVSYQYAGMGSLNTSILALLLYVKNDKDQNRHFCSAFLCGCET